MKAEHYYSDFVFLEKLSIMLSQENITVIFYSLPIYQLLFYTVQLITFKRSKASRKYLGLLLMSMTLFLIIHAMLNLGYIQAASFLYLFYIPLLLALAPVFYLYLLSLTFSRVNIISRIILFLPALLVFFMNLAVFGFASHHDRYLFLMNDHSIFGASVGAAQPPLLVLWFSLFIFLIVQLILAVIKIYSLFKNEKNLSKDYPARLAHINFSWVGIISINLIVFTLACASHILFVEPNSFLFSLLFNLIILVSGGIAGYFGMKQEILLDAVRGVGVASNSFDPKTKDDDKNGTHFSGLSANKIGEIINKIETLMHQDKPYLNKQYNIDELSRQTGVKRHILTQVINKSIGTNFSGLINTHRVREALKMLEANGDDFSFDYISGLVGFNSRSSFYACFRKYTGLTPKEFLKQKK